MKRAICLALVMVGAVVGQATFDGQSPPCAYAFPIGCGALGDIEGISVNGVGVCTVDTSNGSGFPCAGAQYGRAMASAAVVVPTGGPYGGAGGNQMWIPIPASATTVSLCWDFYNAEGGPTGTFNDGMSIDIIGPACGAIVTNLAFADTFTANVGPSDAGGGCSSFGTETGPAGPQTITSFPLPAGSAIIRVTVWNAGDTAVSSHAVIDSVCFDSVPCISPCSLLFLSPSGPGSLAMYNTACPPVAGASYINAITLAPGTFPGGWFFGLDIPFPLLVSEYSTGYPFTGVLDASGASGFGPITGVPSGLTVFAVSAQFAPGFGPFLFARPPVAYVVP